MFDESFVPVSPLSFFQIEVDCLYLDSKNESIKDKKYELPSFAKMTGEDSFADFKIAWNQNGFFVFCDVKVPFQDAFYPEFTRGDSLEILIDTRDVKTSGFNTKYCHHFFFLPQEIDGQKAGEVTRFRTEDAHEICDPNELQLTSQIHKKGYNLNIFIPSQCLYGYDPDQFNRMGFTYRLNRCLANSSHFSVLTDEFKLQQQPSLWSRLNLVKENPTIRKSSSSKR